MIGQIVQTITGSYMRCGAESEPVSGEQDVLDLLACCGEVEANRILLDEAHLVPDLFDLSSGLAGAIFLKLTNYRVKTAIVADLAGIRSERFQELIYESNKGSEINFFSNVAKAEEWLTAMSGTSTLS